MRRWSQRVPSILRSIFFRRGVSMFRRRPDAAPATIAVIVEGRTALVPSGASAAAAVLVAGFRHIRETPVEGRERGPYCMMGICFDCLAEIDGVPNRQSCMVEVRAGMRIRRQIGARKIYPAPP
jgi:hypothetical protein